MRNSIRNRVALTIATIVLAASAPIVTGAQSPSPTPSTSASPAPSPIATSRTAIVSCLSAPLLQWPDRASIPSRTSYPAARNGDAFGVIGTGTIAPGGYNITETTIDVVQPYGTGKHYWIATACIT